jgi:hypothetical protein
LGRKHHAAKKNVENREAIMGHFPIAYIDRAKDDPSSQRAVKKI